MRGKSMILIVIALGCGLVASIGISQIMDRGSLMSGAAVETQEIYVANVDVDINEQITPQMVDLEKWPKDRIPPGAISKLEEIEDSIASQRLYAGEPILKAKLIDPQNQTGVAVTIPKGYRAISVKVTMDSAASGLILPGDLVDVIVYLRGSRGNQARTRTFLKGVRVFAVNTHTTRQADESGNAIMAKTVSLLLTPEQVETVTLATRLGQLSLAMRHPDDDTNDDTEGATLSNILGTSGNKISLAGDTTPETSGNRFLKMIAAAQKQSSSAPQKSNTDTPAAWRTFIFTTNQIYNYRFDDLNQLPRLESTYEVGGAPSNFVSAGPETKALGQKQASDDAEEEQEEDIE